jgi:membrane protease YdiL (CAAX protease family)
MECPMMNPESNLLQPAIAEAIPSRKVQLLEVLVFLFLIMPSMGSAYVVLSSVKVTFVAMAVSSILSDLGLLTLVLYFVWRNGESFKKIGWIAKGAGREALWGFVFFVPMTYGAALLEHWLRAAGFSAPTKLPSFLVAHGPARIVLGTVLVMVVALAEETIFRGYLLLRFRAVTRNVGVAVLLSSVIFALGHGYEGATGLVIVLFLGVVFAIVYLWRGSLVAPMVMHFLQDFISIVLGR